MHTSSIALILVLATVSHFVLFLLRNALYRSRSLPPGPRRLPLIGNLLDMIPRPQRWLLYRDLCATYGNIVYMNSMGRSMLILGDPGLAEEFLEKKSMNTSDRPETPVIELVGQELNVGLMRYGPWWRRHRRAFWQYFHRDACLPYRATQRVMAHRLLGMLLNDPSGLRFKSNVKYTFVASILRVVYGIDAAGEDDPFVALVDDALDAVSQGMIPGRFLVEYLPFLRSMPSWFPGSGKQACFVQWRNANIALKEAPFEHVKNTMNKEESRNSVVGQLLNNRSGLGGASLLVDYEEVVQNVGAVAFEGGADTTYSTILGAFLALSLYPEALKKAQEELDEVVGSDRLPTFEDKDALVYVTATVMEALRWHLVGPLGIPHCTVADDEFHGYLIPAGTIVIYNSWWFMNDPGVYTDPHIFRPERFIRDGKINSEIRDPGLFVFGYGRRICPGRYFAQDSLFINLASILHVFDITPPLDEHGNPIKVGYRLSEGVLAYPEDCRCVIKPRSAVAEDLIRQHAKDAWS